MASVARSCLLATAVALVLGLTAGCTSTPAPAPRESGGTVELKLTGSEPVAVKGSDYRVVDEIPYVFDGFETMLFGILPDGTQVLRSMPPENEPDYASGEALQFRDPSSGKVTQASRHGTEDRWLQFGGETVTGSLATWTETPSRNLYELPWELYSYDATTGIETHLASSKDLGIANPPWPGIGGIVPQQVGDWVYFPAIFDVPKNAPSGKGRSAIFRVPLAGGKPELVVKDAYEVFPDLDPDLIQVGLGDRLTAWDPNKGQDGEVTGSALAVSDGAFAREGVRVAFRDATKPLIIESPDYGKFEVDVSDVEDLYYLNATRRLVTFTVATTEGEQEGYILDLKRQRLMKLKDVVNTSRAQLNGNRAIIYSHSSNRAKTYPLIELLPTD